MSVSEESMECKYEQVILSLKEDMERNSRQHKEFYERFENTAVQEAKTELTYTQILEKLASLESKVDGLCAKPAKRWETVVAAALGAIVAGAVAYFIGG